MTLFNAFFRGFPIEIVGICLTTKLAFPLRIDFRYDNEPPTNIRKHDVEIFNGLRYTF